MPLGKMSMPLPEAVERSLGLVVSRMKAYGVRDFVNSDLAKPSTYLLKYPGKLLRPALVFLGALQIQARNNPGNLKRFVGLAASIELLHTSSLLHDDMVDKDSLRRGTETVHAKYGNERALLAGDALISKAIQESCPYGVDVIKTISKSAMDMCAGEILDYSYQERRKVPNLREYLRMAELKSASLIGTSTSIAAVHNGDKGAQRLYGLGKNLGMAFQIRDDVLDFMGLDGRRAEGKAVRSNIISTLRASYGINSWQAVHKAVALNNAFVEKAFGGMAKGGMPLFRAYANAIRLRSESISL